jgi:hypothetical protein
MNTKQVNDYRNKEREKAEEKLDEYLLICRKLKVFFSTTLMSFLMSNQQSNKLPNTQLCILLILLEKIYQYISQE